MRTRLLGGVGAGRSILPATRLCLSRLQLKHAYPDNPTTRRAVESALQLVWLGKHNRSDDEPNRVANRLALVEATMHTAEA